LIIYDKDDEKVATIAPYVWTHVEKVQ
jgi:hypothetical protein